MVVVWRHGEDMQSKKKLDVRIIAIIKYVSEVKLVNSMCGTHLLQLPLADYLPLGSWVVVRMSSLTPALETHWL